MSLSLLLLRYTLLQAYKCYIPTDGESDLKMDLRKKDGYWLAKLRCRVSQM
jgi:hypothetical protein